jgi:DNA-binding transcriptional MocR family regulator
MDAARRLERDTYCRGAGRHGGVLRDTALRVLHVLLYRGFGRVGACDPSLQQIADAARLARSTVQEAMARLEASGILIHFRRGVVAGGRFVQVTSAYIFQPLARWRSDTGSRSPSESKHEKEALKGAEWPPAPPANEAEIGSLAAKWGLAGT